MLNMNDRNKKIRCKICDKDANATGSHIVPISLFAGMVNSDKSKKRNNKEITFSISSNINTSSSFIGRGVPVETIEQVFGENIINNANHKNKDPLVFDYIFCIDCESKLGIIEGEIDKIFLKKYFNNEFVLDKLSSNVLSINYKSGLFKLYFLSILFRASVVEINGFKLKKKFHNLIKNILLKIFELEKNKILGLGEKIFDEEFTGNMLVISNINGSSSRNLILFNKFCENPYIISLNDFLLIVTENHNTLIDKKKNTFYDFDKILDENAIMKRYDPFKIFLVPDFAWKNYILKTMKILARPFLISLKKEFEELYFKLLKLKPNNATINQILETIILEDCEVGYKYSRDRIDKIYSDYFKQFIS